MPRTLALAPAWWLPTLLLFVASASANADEDIHFLAEHAVESGMDARYMALPWPAGLAPGKWQKSVDLAVAHTTTDFLQLQGTTIAVAAARGVGTRWGYELMASYGDMAISGGDGRVLLTPGYLNQVPLDLPQQSDFSNPRGTERLFGVGAAGVRELSGPYANHSSQLIAGILLERVDITGFRLDYRLVGGANAGASGALEYSSGANFVTPFVSWQQTRTLSAHWTWAPHAMFVAPFPPRDLASRISGPGFDLTAPNGSAAIPIGDTFVTLGLAFRHQPSGLEVDLGGLLYYAFGESASHPGVDNARILHFAWRRPSR